MQIDITSLWNEISKILEIKLDSIAYSTWISPLEAISFEKNHLVVFAPNQFTKKMIEMRFLDDIESCLRFLLKIDSNEELIISIMEPSEAALDFSREKTDSKKTNNNFFVEEESLVPNSDSQDSNLNPSFTFDQFICGKNNEFALASAKAVAESPAKAYNPLFIWGGVGLGKTHLMQACAHYIKEKNPHAKVAYFTAEKFANELIQKIQYYQMEEFRKKYRNVDVLLVDDIQFIAGKKATQEEFFNTFNELHEMNKQIIITSDKPPQEIETLEERLRSRFTMGLITGVSPPDYEVRMAILQQMVDNHDYDVSMEVLDYIASQFESDIRELQGALLRVTAHSKLLGRPIDLDFAKHSLAQIIQTSAKKPITIRNIQEVVSDSYGISLEDLLSKNRSKNIAFPRQVSMYISRELTDLSLPKIADAFNRDHTTIMHGVDKIKALIREDEEFQLQVDDLIKKIKDN